MEEEDLKFYVGKTKVTKWIIAVFVFFIILGIVFFVLKECFKPKEVVIDGNTIYYARVFTDNQFIDTVACVDANDYKLVDESYPETVFYLRNGQVETKVFSNFSEYLDFLIEIKYSDSLELHKLSIPKFVIYSKK